MQSAEELKRTIESTEDLQSVVKTMKALAAVNIRQFEEAAAALADYNRTVELGLQAALRSPSAMGMGRPSAAGKWGFIVFGSDQGMCGQLNDQAAGLYSETVAGEKIGVVGERRLLAVGERVMGRLEDAGERVREYLSVPTSVAGIGGLVRELQVKIEEWERREGIDQVMLFYCRQTGGASFQPETLHLLPVDRNWVERHRRQPWQGPSLPLATADWSTLFSSLIRQYLFVGLFRAVTESLASENASRLASMQGAEKNIRERLGALRTTYHQQRQMTITEELLDIVSGSEALSRD